MQSSAKDVASYIREAPRDRQESLTSLRKLCLDMLAGYEEDMNYGMPCYKRNGVAEIAFASQKNYISLYVNIENVVKSNLALLKGLNVGKGCIRYSTPDKIDFIVVEKLLSDTLEAKEGPC